MIYTVTLNPARDRTVVIPDFQAGKVNRIESLRDDPGGKGINVSKTIKTLGGKSVAMGILGGATGKYLRGSLNAIGIPNDFVQTGEETRTNMKVVDPVNHTTTDINEPGHPVSKRVLTAVFSKLSSSVKPGDIVVFAGRIPAGANATLLADWTKKLNAAGVRVFLDADGEALAAGVQASPYLIKPNDSELKQLLGYQFSSLSEIYAGARRVIDKTGISYVVVSLGADGALFVNEKVSFRGEGLKVRVMSTVGAGDSMMAAMAYGFDTGMPLKDICRLAMATSASSILTAGTECAPMETINELLAQAKVSVYLG